MFTTDPAALQASQHAAVAPARPRALLVAPLARPDGPPVLGLPQPGGLDDLLHQLLEGNVDSLLGLGTCLETDHNQKESLSCHCTDLYEHHLILPGALLPLLPAHHPLALLVALVTHLKGNNILTAVIT